MSKQNWIACNLVLIGTCVFCCGPRALAQNTTFQYFYDDIGQLIKVIDSSGNDIDYIYDPLGNLLHIKRGTAPTANNLAILAFTPANGNAGTLVTIQGQAFGTSPGATTVSFNGTAATVVSATPSTLTAIVPSGATTGPISVTVGATTVTSAMNFTVAQVPVILSLSRKSALFNTVINNVAVSGTHLLNSTFSFQTPAIGVGTASPPSDTSATLNLVTGSTPGTFGLVANTALGNSSPAVTKANRFTIVDPASTADTDADGVPDALEALAGTDPLDPTSFPVSSPAPAFGEADSTVASVLNTQPAATAGMVEADAVVFSLLNTAPPTGNQSFSFEADGIAFSLLNTAPPRGAQSFSLEADGTAFSLLNTYANTLAGIAETDSIVFSVQNGAHPSTSGATRVISQPLLDSDGDGYPDELETLLGSDPHDANSIPVVKYPPEADSTLFSIFNDGHGAAIGTSGSIPQPAPTLGTGVSNTQVGIRRKL